jgi:DNA-binding Lrp family transcriptional regulator
MVSQKSKINEVRHQEPTFDDRIPYKLFDTLNIKIVKELVNNPDISSTEIAAKYDIPLSTIQRRRAKIEESVLKKTYTLDIGRLGWRIADLLVSVEKGKGEETAQKLLQTNGSNVIIASLRIGHPQVNIMAEIFYKDSQELHYLTERVKGMQYVTYVEWAEVVKIVGSNFPAMLEKVFNYAKN